MSGRANLIRTPVSRRPSGIETFRVEGTIYEEPVHAQWDGRWMTATNSLCEMVAIAMAVDAAFVEAGLSLQLRAPLPDPAPEDYLLAVLACCDAIDVAEFEIQGCRRVIAPDVDGSPTARDEFDYEDP
jgi:hypothetical protein